VSAGAEIPLWIIAVSTLFLALVQIAVIVGIGLVVRRMFKMVENVERELKPFIDSVNQIGLDASRAASLAAAQVERADELIAETMTRVEQLMATIQETIVAPAREGRAMLSALKAIVEAFKGSRGRRRADDEDALFI
jgi:hypothetical protein